jgi:hypothetical protein
MSEPRDFNDLMREAFPPHLAKRLGARDASLTRNGHGGTDEAADFDFGDLPSPVGASPPRRPAARLLGCDLLHDDTPASVEDDDPPFPGGRYLPRRRVRPARDRRRRTMLRWSAQRARRHGR